MRYVPREQHAVDQHTELRVREIPHEVDIRNERLLLLFSGLAVRHHAFLFGRSGFDLKPGVYKKVDVAAHRLAVHFHAVLVLKIFDYLLLRDRVSRVGMPLQYPQYVYRDQFFGVHFPTSRGYYIIFGFIIQRGMEHF